MKTGLFQKIMPPEDTGPREWKFPNGNVAYTYRGQLVVVPQGGNTAPPPPPPPPTPEPLTFANGGFEAGLAGWTPFWTHGSTSAYNLESLDTGADPLAVHGGRNSARLSAEFRCWRGGWYQVVEHLQVGQAYRLSAWFLTFGAGFPNIHNCDVNMNRIVGVGVDPQGLTDPGAGRVDWKLAPGNDLVRNIGGVWEPVWQPVTHEFRATFATATVFILADLGALGEGRSNWPLPFTAAFFDDVQLEAV